MRPVQPSPASSSPATPEPALELAALRQMANDELADLAEQLGVEDLRALRRQDLVLAILTNHAARRGETHAEGILEILAEGFGFLRDPELNYSPGSDDIYVSPSQIRRFGMRTGDRVRGTIRAPKESERYFALIRVESIEGGAPDQHPQLVDFDDRIALSANRSFALGAAPAAVRVADLYCPLGFGQRILVRAPPRAGKTGFLIELVQAVARAHPSALSTLVAIDLRPEDAEALQHQLGSLAAVSTMADPPARHVQLVELAIERGKRAAERGQDALVAIDSLGRLARAYNVVAPTSGRTLIGALDAAAVSRVKRVLAAARRLDSGGSLTVVASLATQSGARIDEVLADELAETASVELALTRSGDYTALDPTQSFVRHPELLLGAQAEAWRRLAAAPPPPDRVLTALPRSADRDALLAALAPQ